MSAVCASSFPDLQQRQQREGLDAGAGMRHATSCHIQVVSREDLSRLHIDDNGCAATAGHCAGDGSL